ncbi:hypothetical protein BaRGS_00021659 [Batillaria attramentaria]|uniref:Uncharacterized protein n=1 Tax=Batillaria attramentaria TaxID=370345 RepID=A0ABD0KJB2_9CAEN
MWTGATTVADENVFTALLQQFKHRKNYHQLTQSFLLQKAQERFTVKHQTEGCLHRKEIILFPIDSTQVGVVMVLPSGCSRRNRITRGRKEPQEQHCSKSDLLTSTPVIYRCRSQGSCAAHFPRGSGYTVY